MAFTLEGFDKWYEQNKKGIADEMYRQADLDVNGSQMHYEAIGREVESHPLISLRLIGLRGTSLD